MGLVANRLRPHTNASQQALALLAAPPLQPAGQAPRLALLARAGTAAATPFGPAARHASMRAVIDWSWRQLTPQQQRLAGALAVFHGGATLAALGEVDLVIAGMLAPPNMGPAFARSFNTTYPFLARKYDAPLYPFFMRGVAANRALLLKDGIHPNPRGVTVIVNGILPTVKAGLGVR